LLILSSSIPEIKIVYYAHNIYPDSFQLPGCLEKIRIGWHFGKRAFFSNEELCLRLVSANLMEVNGEWEYGIFF
jgi:hypothetical protein